MPDFLQTVIDIIIQVVVYAGITILPLAVFLYVVIAHGGKLFSFTGRVNRLTYWEGLSTWIFLNAFTLMFLIMYMMYTATFLIKTLADKTVRDADYTIYNKLYLGLFFVQWVFTLCTLLPICIKRWRDLRLPPSLVALNAAPVALVGGALLVFFGNLGETLFQNFITNANALGAGNNAFTVLGQARDLYIKLYVQAHPVYYCFIVEIMVGAFLYLGLAPGVGGGAAARKKSSSASPRPSRV
jgi:uncharacterized membrane protein YhaH (DUF805 family)